MSAVARRYPDAAVCLLCYGVLSRTVEDEKGRKWKRGLAAYYGGAVEAVQRLCEQVSVSQVIACGGYTAEDMPYTSEAYACRERVGPVFRSIGINMVLEERSRNTPQNLKFAADIMDQSCPRVSEVVVICDTPRQWKVRAMIWWNRPFGRRRCKVVGVDRPDPSWKSATWFQLGQAVLYALPIIGRLNYWREVRKPT